MLILQSGVPKSGNLWLYRILQGVAKHAGLEQRSFIQRHPIHEQAKTWKLSYPGQADVDSLDVEPRECFLRISHVFWEPIPDIDDYLGQCSHVWTHSPICSRSFGVLPKFDRVVHIIRDPRDVAISMSRYVFTPHVLENYPPHYEKDPDSFRALTLDGTLRDWVQHVGGYLRYKDRLRVHVVFYERLLHGFQEELSDLLRYLDIQLDQEALRQIESEVSFSSMKKESPFHVSQGRSGNWSRVFPLAQKQQAERIAGRMLRLLNYPVTEDALALLPRLPEKIDLEELDRAIQQSRRTARDEISRVWVFMTSKRPLRAKVNRVRELAYQAIKKIF